jgi:hypothetical protein
MRSIHRATRLALLCACLGGAAVSAGAADWKDWFFGKTATDAPVNPEKKVWQIGEFTSVQRVPREAGSAPNQHPALVQIEGLRQALGAMRLDVGGKPEPLFGNDELTELVEPLRQALSVAGPGDDLLLLSSDRRGQGFLAPQLTLTARLFVQGDQLNLIVRDARQDFISMYLGMKGNMQPTFTYGSRTTVGSAKLQSVSASSKRADWMLIPMGAAAVTATATVAAPAPGAVPLLAPAAAAAATAVPLSAAPAVAAAPVSAPVAPVAAAATLGAAATVATPQRGRDASYMEEQELRLKTLKRLRDSGLISEDEYLQKRREVLQAL